VQVRGQRADGDFLRRDRSRGGKNFGGGILGQLHVSAKNKTKKRASSSIKVEKKEKISVQKDSAGGGMSALKNSKAPNGLTRCHARIILIPRYTKISSEEKKISEE